MASDKKLILVLGATGAQGIAVIDQLLAPSADGSPSPYAIRALTRDPSGKRALELAAQGVECVKGSLNDIPSILLALQGVYGAWINVDGFTVGEEKETYLGIRIFELAKQVGTVKHFVWSSIDYGYKKSGYNPIYQCGHTDAKGRVADWMKSQASLSDGMTWTVVTTCPYMEMLGIHMFGPLHKREDGTFVFATPVGEGRVPMIALRDLGLFARYTFDHRDTVSGQDLEIASDIVNWDYLVSTFKKVTGQKAVVLHQSLDEWFNNLENVDLPLANDINKGVKVEGVTTWRKNFTAWWSLYRDNIVVRDLDWIRKVNPQGYTLEKWMRENSYTGQLQMDVLKNVEDGKDNTSVRLNQKVVSRL